MEVRYREEGGGVEAGERSTGPSIRRYGCDAKVPNIPEVKVNRLVCVDFAARNIQSFKLF